MYEHFIGIDVSKDTIDACLLKKGGIASPVLEQFSNSQEGFKKLAAWAKASGAKPKTALAGLEHTGIYTEALEGFLHKKGWQFAKPSASSIKGASPQIKGKTDRLDAQKIARYLYFYWEELPLATPAPASIEELRELSALRARLVKSKVLLETPDGEIKQARGKYLSRSAERATEAAIEALKAEIAAVELAIKQLIESDEQMKAAYALVTSVPGVGPVNAVAFIIATHNFSRFDCPRKFASYAGVAPFKKESGREWRRPRVLKGDTDMKALLSMAANAAIHCDPQIKAYYLKKKAEGKHEQAVRNAVMNKIIHRVFAVVRRKQEYVPLGRHAA
jgi:transposase